MTFSKILTDLRTESGLTQKELASKINFGKSIVYYWETGQREPTSKALIALSNFFNVSIDFLLGREDDFGNVVVSAPNGNVSRADEKLLKDFYALGPFEQEYIRGQIQALLNTSREVIKK